MEKLLIMGINTRGLVNSCLKLPYQCYSISYYFTSDFKSPFKEKHILNQVEGNSCGFFEKNYSPEKLLELSLDYIDEIDNIVLSSGISPTDFKGKFKKYKKKILGNTEITDIEDKYKFYRKIKNKFLTPKTFKINHGNDEDNIHETYEILKQNINTSFIIKPIQGSGGYGVKYLKYDDKNNYKIDNYFDNKIFSDYEKTGFIIQEYIEGTDISSSVLSTKTTSKTIITSKILTESDFGVKNSFKYCGNIVPFNIGNLDNTTKNNKNNNINHNNNNKNNNNNINYNNNNKNNNNINKNNKNDDINANIYNISEELISQSKLIGSNGIDMILTNETMNKKKEKNGFEDPYIIEINPRFQGTYECIEEVLGVNLLDAHIKACEGELIDIPPLKKELYSMKRLIYSNNKIKIGNIAKNHNIFDIPFNGTIIEKDEPLVTIITPKSDLEIGKNILKKSIDKLNKNINFLN